MSFDTDKEKAFLEIEKIGKETDEIIANIKRLNTRILAIQDQVDSELNEAERLNKRGDDLFNKYFKDDEE